MSEFSTEVPLKAEARSAGAGGIVEVKKEAVLRRGCNRCAGLKRRCDGGKPCTRCQKAEALCFYDAPRKRKNNKEPLQLDRTRMRASTATGLVGRREHSFLRAYLYSLAGCIVPLDCGALLASVLLRNAGPSARGSAVVSPPGLGNPRQLPGAAAAAAAAAAAFDAREALKSALASAVVALGCLVIGGCSDHVRHMLESHDHSERAIALLLASNGAPHPPLYSQGSDLTPEITPATSVAAASVVEAVTLGDRAVAAAAAAAAAAATGASVGRGNRDTTDLQYSANGAAAVAAAAAAAAVAVGSGALSRGLVNEAYTPAAAAAAAAVVPMATAALAERTGFYMGRKDGAYSSSTSVAAAAAAPAATAVAEHHNGAYTGPTTGSYSLSIAASASAATAMAAAEAASCREGSSRQGGSEGDSGDGLPREAEALLCILLLMQTHYHRMTGDTPAEIESANSAVDMFTSIADTLEPDTRDRLGLAVRWIYCVNCCKTEQGGTFEDYLILTETSDDLSAAPATDVMHAQQNLPRAIEWLMFQIQLPPPGPPALGADALLRSGDLTPSRSELEQKRELADWCFMNSVRRLRDRGEGAVWVYNAYSLVAAWCLKSEGCDELSADIIAATDAMRAVMEPIPGLWTVLPMPKLFALLCGKTRNRAAYDQLLANWAACQLSAADKLPPLPPYEEPPEGAADDGVLTRIVSTTDGSDRSESDSG